MNKRINPIIKLQMYAFKNTFIAFWIVFVVVYVGLIAWVCIQYPPYPYELDNNLIYNYPYTDAILIGGVSGIFIFLIYVGFSSVNRTFVHSLSFSVTRKEFFISNVIFLLFFTFLNATLQTLFYFLLETRFSSAFSRNFAEIYYFSFKGMKSFGMLLVFLIHFLISVNITFPALSLGSLYYRFGKPILYLVLVILLFLIAIKNIDWWINLLILPPNFKIYNLIMPSIIITAISLLISWLPIKQAPVYRK